MLARNTQLRGEFLSDRQVRRGKTVIYYIKCTVAVQVRSKVAGGIFDAISYHLAAEALAFVPQKRLIAAENSRAALLQTLENLQFGLADASREPRNSICEVPMLVITARFGLAAAVMRESSPK